MYKSLLFLLLTASQSFAGSAYFGLYTDHTVPGEFNETNRVYMVQSDTGVTAGTMVNSYGRRSFMAGYTQPSDNLITFGLVLATGYEPENFYLEDHLKSTPVVPFPVVSLNIPVLDNVHLTTNVIGGIVINAGIRAGF